MSVSGVNLADHQVVAAARAISILAQRGGVLLADVPGLGKSYVAAAVAKELGGRVELIVPAGLIAQWRETLESFGLDAEIESHESIRAATWSRLRLRRLVIVDEAHAFRNPRTERYDRLARRTAGADVLLVTATPLCNSAADLLALLQLIVRDDALADCGVPSIDAAFEQEDRDAIDSIVASVMIRRDWSAVPESVRVGPLERRVLQHDVAEVGLESLRFPGVSGASLLRRFLQRRLESSEAALIESLRRQRRFYQRVLESGRPLSKAEYRRAFVHEQDRDEFQQVLFWDLWSSSGVIEPAGIHAEIDRLDTICEVANGMPRTKIELLRSALSTADAPVLIFTGFAATAREVGDAVGCPVAIGGDARGAIEAFRRGRADVIVATDFASEGLNLQRAGVVVHYDLPWNPVKLDQRNGRAHRIGQRRELVRAIYFLPRSDDTRIVATIAAKNRLRRRVLRSSTEEMPNRGELTIRPRVTRESSAARLIEAAARAGLDVPAALERRSRAGLDRLVEDVLRAGIDRPGLERLLAIVARER